MLNAAVVETSADPTIQAPFAELGPAARAATSEGSGDSHKAEIGKWRPIVAMLGNAGQKMLVQIPKRNPIELISYYDEFAWYYPTCEMETKRWFVDNVQSDWCIFDIGANVGYYSILFSRLAPSGQIFAFEPTSTEAMLRANLAHHQVRNIEVHKIAVGRQPGLRTDDIFRIWGHDAERNEYPFVSVDSFVQERKLTKVDCLKIDVDSFDFEVLQGVVDTLQTMTHMLS